MESQRYLTVFVDSKRSAEEEVKVRRASERGLVLIDNQLEMLLSNQDDNVVLKTCYSCH